MVESKGGSQWNLWGIYKLVDIIEWSNLTIFKGHEMYSSLFVLPDLPINNILKIAENVLLHLALQMLSK